MSPDATPGSMDAQEWKRVRDLLHQALALPPESRAVYLDQACGGDAGLRAELDSLIAASGQPAFFDRPAMTTAQPAGVLQAGAVIGHYQVVEKLGEGGMGAVYKAIDTRLERAVALKVISEAQAGWVLERRFAREAKAASALNHPNIVTIYEFNAQDGVDYIAMEYVQGTTLNTLCAGDRPPIATLLEYARQAAGALAKAHEAGIVHRDLKPANIMVTGDGLVKVLDFGLAKREHPAADDPDATQTQGLTQAGRSVGTPAYMSPEQVMGEVEDWRSDIFSFGVILYELACGCRPFGGKTVHATMTLIAHEEPAAPAEVNPSVPAALAVLIERCLEKNPAERPQSMEEVAAALAAIVQAPPASPTRGNTRRWLLAGVLGAVGLVALAAVLWVSRGNQPAALPRPGLTYTIEAQKMRGGQPLGEPYAASAADAFEGGWRFRLRAQPAQSGFFYLINEGPDETGAARLWILYPKGPGTAAPPNQETLTGWMVFDRNPGTEKLWIVWSGQPVSAFEKTLSGGTGGRVESQDTAAAIKTLLAGLRPAQRKLERSGAIKLEPDGSAGILGEVLELKHQ